MKSIIHFAKILIDNKIIPEFYDEDFLVLMVSSETSVEELHYLLKTLKKIPKKVSIEKIAANKTIINNVTLSLLLVYLLKV